MSKKSYKSEGKTRVLLNLLSDPAVIIDQKGLFLMANDEFGKETGLNPKELIGKPFLNLDILPAKSKAVLLENLSAKLQGVNVTPYEIQFTNASGEARFIEVKGKIISYAGQPADLVVFHDVTRTKENARRLKEYAERMEALVAEKVKEIKESEEKFRAISTYAKDAIVAADSEGEIVYWNPAAERIFGYSQEEVVGKSVLNLIIPPRNRGFQQIFVQQVQNRQLSQGKILEFTALRKDGTEFPAELSAAMMNFENKSCLLGIVRDVSERKKAEEALRASEAKLRAITNSVFDAVFLFDEEDTIIHWNAAAERIFGYAEKEIVGKKVSATIVPARFRKAHCELAGKIAKGKEKSAGQIWEFPALKKDGAEFPMELSMAPLQLNSKTYVTAIARDITERKRIEEVLRDSEERIRGIFESSPDPITVSSADAKIIDCNSAALKTFGYSTKSEVIGRNVFEFFAERERARAAENFARQGDTVVNAEYIFQTKNGREFPGELSTSPVLNPSGKIACFVSTLKDITERKEKEKALRNSEDRFKQVADNADEWIWEVAPNGMYTYSSPVVEKILGYKPEEIVGKKRFYDLFHPENREQLKEAALQAFEQKQPFHGLLNKNVHKSGRAVWLSTSGVPIVDDEGKLVGYRGADTNITEFKKAEETLRASEAKYRELINGMNDTAWVIGLGGMFIDVNDAAVKTLGYAREELLSMGPWDIDNTLSREQIIDLVTRMPADQIQVFETAHNTKDGRKIPVEISSSLVTYQGKKAILSIARDITERKKAKEKMMKDQEELNLIINSSPVIIFYKDKEGKFLRVNKAFAEALQTSPREFVGKTVFDFYSTEIAQSMTNDDREVVQSGRPKFGIIEQYESASGLRWVQTDRIPTFGENGVPNGLVGFALDITERKKTQENLRVSEARFRAISNSVRDAIILVNDKETIEYWNPAAEKTFGYTREEAIGQKLHDLIVPSSICPEGKMTIAQGVKRFAQTGIGKFIGETVELTACRKDGSELPIKLSLSPIKLGNIWHAVGVAKDITEEKQKEQMAIEYSDKLEKAIAARTNELQIAQASLLKLERLAAIGELADMVGHDLRNPLTGIKNAAYYLRVKQNTCSEIDRNKMLGIIDNAIDHSDKIIRDLQDYAREICLEPERCSPRSILQEALTLMHVPDRVKIVDKTLEKPVIKLDKTKMVRVFMNIIKNAVDAMPKGGTLQIKNTKKKGNVETSFADTGIGIPKENLGKLFSPLVTTKAQGMGFGLAICKRILDAHQGRITVQSVEGKGSTFTLTIPIKPKLEDGGETTWVNLPESLLSTTTKT